MTLLLALGAVILPLLALPVLYPANVEHGE